MTDVIGCQQKSAGAICIFALEYPNTRDTAKQQSHQQPANAIRCGFGLHWLSVSRPRCLREPIFQADSFFERGIILAVPTRGLAMKPRSPFTGDKGQFPHTDYFFHSGFGHWRGGYFSPYDGEDKYGFRNFYNLGREFRLEAARERAREMAVFALIVLTSAWPVLYMVITVVKVLSRGRPVDQ
jgi:hypothetical protein